MYILRKQTEIWQWYYGKKQAHWVRTSFLTRSRLGHWLNYSAGVSCVFWIDVQTRRGFCLVSIWWPCHLPTMDSCQKSWGFSIWISQRTDTNPFGPLWEAVIFVLQICNAGPLCSTNFVESKYWPKHLNCSSSKDFRNNLICCCSEWWPLP